MSSLYLVNVGQWRSGPAKEGADELGLLFDNVEGAVFHPVAERNRSAHPDAFEGHRRRRRAAGLTAASAAQDWSIRDTASAAAVGRT